jgi:hypothetical protein
VKKSLVLIALLLLSSLGLIYGFSVRGREGKAQDPLKQEKKKEKSRSVYKGSHNPHSEKVVDLAAAAKGDVKLEREIGLPTLTPAPANAFNLEEFLAKRACDADAILIGTAASGSSHLTEDGSFLYTVYDFQVESIIKNNPLHALTAGQSITVFRTGGTMVLNGKRVVAEYKAAKTLDVGNRYLLFLSFFSEKSAYAADNVGYGIRNQKILKLTEQTLEPALEAATTLTALSNLSAKPVRLPACRRDRRDDSSE